MSKTAMISRLVSGRFGSLVLASLFVVSNAASIPVQFNTARTYGFDGPWQAVSIHVGGFQNGLTPSSQWTTVDVFPGGLFDSFIPTPDLCQTNSSHFCGAGGVWDPSGNQTADGDPIDYEPSTSNSGGNGIFQQGMVYAQNLVIPSTSCPGGGDCIIPGASLVALDTANVTLPNGQTTQLELGSLALGAPAQTQDFTTGSDVEGEDTINTWNAPGYLFNKSIIASDSYSLHIGAAQYGYPGSLIFGGFDQGRAIGPATSWSASSNPQLLDIIIDIETGGSPFNYSSAQTGLLITNTSNAAPITVAPMPNAAYLGLPKQTCDNLARYLPIQFDTASQYYFWNTEDPMYSKIVNSPAYLGFTFPPAAGNTDNVIIKVPFMLLNLTLKEVASGRSGDTTYFPCVPYTPTGGSNVYTLGRAFLQSALVAGNFATGISWLAQAPGPGSTKNGLGSAPQPVDIEPAASTLTFVAQASDNSFNNSWSSYWTPIEGSFASINGTNALNVSDTTAPDQSSSGGGLSTGAEAGIGVGVAVAVIALLAAAAFYFIRRRRARGGKTPSENEPFVPSEQQQNRHGYQADAKPAIQPPQETAQELGGGNQQYDHPYGAYKGVYAPQYNTEIPLNEMPATQTNHFELPVSDPIEMDASQNHPAIAEAPHNPTRSPV